ncbi:hypothetical protein V8C43DRAFT_292180 [Trichoderma afarasin]
MGPAAQPTLPPSATLIGRAAASWCITGASFGAGASLGVASRIVPAHVCVHSPAKGWLVLPVFCFLRVSSAERGKGEARRGKKRSEAMTAALVSRCLLKGSSLPSWALSTA